MTKIIRYQNTCKIVDTDDIELFKALDKELSFKIQGAEYSVAYQGYYNDRGEFITWDGRRHLMTGSGKFPAGLFPRVHDWFLKKKIPFDIVDERPVKDLAPEIEIASSLKELDKYPRPYQIEAADTAIAHDRGVIRMATGAGKTLVAALITAKLGQKTIIYVIGKDLLYQLQKFFTNIFKQEIGIIGDGKCEIRDINVATVWSIGQVLGAGKDRVPDDQSERERKIDPAKHRQIKEMLRTTPVNILDECHLAACDTVQVISRNIKADYVYGMSASPWRDDGGDMLIEAFLGRRIIDISARQLINQGYLVEPDIRFLAPKPYSRKTGKYQTIYSKYITQNDQRNAMIVKGATKMVEHGFIPLVLFHSIRHGEILHEKLNENIPTAMLSGKDSSKVREKIKQDLEDGKVKCLAASKIFDIGVDLPILSGLIVAGAGKSSVRALQRIGRVIRPSKDKKMAAVIDFCDQAPYLQEHAKIRRKIYESEFNVKWPKK